MEIDTLFSSMQRTVMKHSSKQWGVMETLGQWEPNMGRKNIVEIRNPILNKIYLLSKFDYYQMREMNWSGCACSSVDRASVS